MLYYKSKPYKKAYDVVFATLGDSLPPKKDYGAGTSLFAARIMEITNHRGDDYKVHILCFDEGMSVYNVTIHCPILDWVDIIACSEEHRTLEDAEKIQESMKRYDMVAHSELINGCWINIGPEKIWWVRVYLKYYVRRRGLFDDIKMLNELIVGNMSIPSKTPTAISKLKFAGIPMFQWFTIDKTFKGEINGIVGKYTDHDGHEYIFDQEIGIWTDVMGNKCKPPIDHDTIHTKLNDIEILSDSDDRKQVFSNIAYDIEVSNDLILKSTSMPIISNLESKINVISFIYRNSSKILREFSVVLSR